jgi:hypothetical protein
MVPERDPDPECHPAVSVGVGMDGANSGACTSTVENAMLPYGFTSFPGI